MKTTDPDLLHYIEREETAAHHHPAADRVHEELRGDRGPCPAVAGYRDALFSTAGHGSRATGSTLSVAVEGLEVFADPLLEKVFENLIDNSRRHGERVRHISFSTLQYGLDYLALVYEDDGVGVHEEDKERIFEKGFGKNTGLGLFLTREILSITGLTIKESGVYGKGARFEILVPKGKYRFTRSGKGQEIIPVQAGSFYPRYSAPGANCPDADLYTPVVRYPCSRYVS